MEEAVASLTCRSTGEVLLIEAMRRGEFRRLYLGVPVDAIVALDHRNFARGATTWRNLLAGIHGIGWGHGALAWMESDVGTTAGDLRLCAVGGAIRCGNGMHRLVATACWLAAGVNGGKGRASLEICKVNVQAQGLHAPSASLIRDAVDMGATVHVCARANGGDCDGSYIRIVSGRSVRFFEYERASLTLEEIAPRRRLREWVRSRLRPAAEDAFGLRWQRVTPRVACALASDKWLREQLESPRYPDLPS